mmetsp:Transcript_9046/g.14705  ORF Transcript_9046/g.14705 Transcript_9046/m.14705 type:complete len:526 (+) Transcript_9046:1156-2733(+)
MKYILFLFTIAAVRCCLSKKPNFLVFMVDDMGYQDLACFGRKNVSTPNIDEMAEQGVKFTQWMSAASICTPSRAAMQTGRLPVRFGMTNNGLPDRVFFLTASTGGIPDDEETLAQALVKQGYRTGMSGKWHLGISSVLEKFHYLPPKKGYQSWLGIPYTNMHKCKEIPENGQGKYWCMLMANETIVQQPLIEQNLTRALTQHALDFITASVESGDPFFFLFNFLHVHTPLFTSPEFKGVSKGGIFGDNVEEMDHAVGIVLNKIKELGVDDNTLAIITSDSDNGPFAEEGYDYSGRTGGLKGSKGQTYEGGIRMPGIARWPQMIPPGVTTDTLVGTIDLFPTFLSLAGGQAKSDVIDGKDISQVLLHPETAPTPYEYMFHYCGKNLAAVRQVLVDGTVVKYHLLTQKWKNKGNTALCSECCPYGIFAFGGKGGSLCNCRVGVDAEEHPLDSPVVYDMTNDMYESVPLTEATFPGGPGVYRSSLAALRAAVQKHRGTIKRSKNQLIGFSPFNFPCCNGIAFWNTCEC